MLRRGIPERRATAIADQASLPMAAEELHLFPGIDALLRGLSPHYHVVVITSNHGDLVRAALEREGQSDRIGDVLGCEAGASKTRKISRTIARHHQPAHVYVGDTGGDMTECLAAGARPIGVAWG